MLFMFTLFMKSFFKMIMKKISLTDAASLAEISSAPVELVDVEGEAVQK